MDTISQCKRSIQNSAKNCHNYIRIIIVQNEQLLTCGTNANKPICAWRSLNNLNKINEQFEASGKCPQSPDTSMSYLKLFNNDYYFATSIDYSVPGMKPDYLIERSLGPSKQVRTDQYNSNWLNDPQFVASIEIGDYVYFFMRETAIEFMNCGQV